MTLSRIYVRLANIFFYKESIAICYHKTFIPFQPLTTNINSWGIHLEPSIRTPAFHIRVPGLCSHFWLLTPPSHQWRPWQAVVMAQVIVFLIPTRDLCIELLVPSFDPGPISMVEGIWRVKEKIAALFLFPLPPLKKIEVLKMKEKFLFPSNAS